MRKIKLLILTAIVMLGTFAVAYAAEDAFTASERFFGDVRAWILKVSIAALVIGIGSGAFMKKFSFGDQNKIKMGSTVIWASIAGWTLINGVPLIAATIQKYIN